jgi:hypothetical protein
LLIPKPSSGNGGSSSTSYSQVVSRDNSTAVQINTVERNDKPTNPLATTDETMLVTLTTNRVVDPSTALIQPKYRKNKDKATNPNLYDISLPLNKSARNEEILWLVCQYVENYLL